jgi:hypothetical protein
LPGRQDGAGDDPYLDTTRLTHDTGVAPTFDVAAAVADNLAWRADNPAEGARDSAADPLRQRRQPWARQLRDDAAPTGHRHQQRLGRTFDVRSSTR